MIRPPQLLPALATILMTGLMGCGSDTTPFPDRCNIKVVSITPESPSIRVGESVGLHATYTPGISADCIPDTPATALRWTSSDTVTAQVDSLTGMASGRRAGTVLVGVHLPGASNNLGGVQLSVTAP